MHVNAPHLGLAFALLADTRCQPDRSLVFRLNNADDVRFVEVVEAVIEKPLGGLGVFAFPASME